VQLHDPLWGCDRTVAADAKRYETVAALLIDPPQISQWSLFIIASLAKEKGAACCRPSLV
jgi:hypothetical protein